MNKACQPKKSAEQRACRRAEQYGADCNGNTHKGDFNHADFQIADRRKRKEKNQCYQNGEGDQATDFFAVLCFLQGSVLHGRSFPSRLQGRHFFSVFQNSIP